MTARDADGSTRRSVTRESERNECASRDDSSALEGDRSRRDDVHGVRRDE